MNTINKQYNQSFAGRLRTQKQYHFSKVAEFPENKQFDNFKPHELAQIWNNQNGVCVCCGLPLTFEKADISHISKGFFFKASNFQLLHHGCNLAQGDLVMPFANVKRMYGEYLLDLLNNSKTRDWVIEELSLSANSVKRFDARIKSILAGKV